LTKIIRKEREEEMKRKQNLISKLSSQPTNTRETRKSKEIREKVRMKIFYLDLILFLI